MNGGSGNRPAWGLAVLWPLVFAPLPLIAYFYGDLLPPVWLANLLFYLPILILSLVIAPLLTRLSVGTEPAGRGKLSATAVVAGTTLLFFLTGLYYTHSCGEHAGDEGHYLILATSLFEDGDLDIRNNLENEVGAENLQRLGPDYLHVSPASRPPHWYSAHAPGLAFLLAPFVPGGNVARHGVLGLIAGLACGAMWLLCRRAGASPPACGIALTAFGLSLYWCVYASRALPEVLGAALVAWLCWSVLAQAEYPWRTTCLALVCCAFLPWVHIRFYPLALAGLALYPLYGLRTAEPCARRWLRLGIFLLAGLGSVAVYRFIQYRMYEGGFSHSVGELLFHYPRGLWRIFTDPAGLLNILPLAFWMGAATLVWLAVGRTRRGVTLALIGLFATAWLTACAVPNYFGGSTVGGRFLVVVMPLLLPAAAALWDQVTPAARWWFVFLALISMALLVLELLHLPQLGRSFSYPYNELPVVIHKLQALRLPLCSPRHALVVFMLTIILVSLRGRRPAAWLAAAMPGLSLVWHVLSRP